MLQAMQIVGGRGQEVVFNGFGDNGSDKKSFTFSDRSFGRPFKNRLIVVGLVAHTVRDGASKSMTVAGVSAVAQVKSQYPFPRVEIWSAEVATGTSGNISVSFSDTSIHTSIGVWSVYGLVSPVAYNTHQDNQAASAQINLEVPGNGVAVAMAGQRPFPTGAAKGITWGGDTLSYTGDFDASAGSVSGASEARLPDSPIFTVTATPASGSATLVGTTWR